MLKLTKKVYRFFFIPFIDNEWDLPYNSPYVKEVTEPRFDERLWWLGMPALVALFFVDLFCQLFISL